MRYDFPAVSNFYRLKKKKTLGLNHLVEYFFFFYRKNPKIPEGNSLWIFMLKKRMIILVDQRYLF